MEIAESVTPPGQPSDGSGEKAPPPRRRASWPWRLLLVLVVLGALAYAGWEGWRRWQAARSAEEALYTQLSQELTALKSDLQRLAAREDAIERQAGESSSGLESLRARVEQAEDAIGRLSLDAQGGRSRLQLAAIEQLLLLANDRALLARDAVGAAQALEQAQTRLAALDDPRLFRLREAIAQERAALRAVGPIDTASVSLSLASLVQQVPKLPLQAVPARSAAASAERAETLPPGAGWTERLWHSVRSALRASFSVRRDDGAVPRLLAPEQEALVVQLLVLKLEGARLALLRGDGAAFRDFCAGAQHWLADYFRAGDPAVVAAKAELGRLAALDIAPALPELTRSLGLLRELLQQ